MRPKVMRWQTIVGVAGALALACAACDDGTVSAAGVSQGGGTGGSGSDGGSVGGGDSGGASVADVGIVGGDSGTGGSGATDGGSGSTGADAAQPSGDVALPPADAAPVDPAMSCQNKCGQAQPKNWKCQCDPQCVKYNDCCPDYQAVCSGGGPGPGPDPAQILGCLEKSCGSNVDACKANDLCAKFWECAKSCKDSNCLQTCAQKYDLNQLGPVLQPMLDCGQKAACFDGGGGPGPQPSGPVCGDGKCEQPENNLNCAKDCPDTPAGAAQKCLYDKCKDQYNACFNSQPCVAAVACINNGGSPNQCAGDKQTAQQLNGMINCGNKNGCFGGQPPPTQCGNGKCEPGETYVNCAKDCPAPPPPTDPLTKCVADKCADSYAACVASEGCNKALQCVAKGGNVQSCASSAGGGYQQLIAVGQCAYKNGCLSDPGTGGGGSCKGKCGQFTPGAACQCNAECGTFKNCCGDYATQCGTTPPTAVCGDGVCTTPAETATSCPKDCGSGTPPPAKPCKSKGDCADNEICCGLANGQQVCATPANCK